MVVWFVDDRRARRALASSQRARRCSRRSSPRHAVAFFVEQRLAAASSCSARCSWSSPAARRSTPTWATSARRPIRLAWFALVLPALLLNYFGQGALAARATRRPHRIRSICLAPDWAALSARRARDRGHGDRVAGADLGRLLAHAPGDAARLLPAPADRATPRPRESGQIYVPPVNWALMVACVRARDRLRLVGESRRRVRHGGHGHDGDHDGAAVRRRAAALGLGPGRGRARRRVPAGRPRLPRRQPAQDRGRRLVLRCWSRRSASP